MSKDNITEIIFNSDKFIWTKKGLSILFINDTSYTFSGKRISRGLYRSKIGTIINADLNGSANILRKVVPTAFVNGIAAVCSQPRVVNVR